MLSLSRAAKTIPTFTLPSDADLDLANRFNVNKHYLQSLASFIEQEYRQEGGLNQGLANAIRTRNAYQRIRGTKAVDLKEVERWLTLGWASEVQLHLPSSMGIDSVIGFSNAWAPVHAYYAVYGLLQAWFAANGMQGLTNDHTGTLKTISVQLRDRELLPAPWSVLAEGCPMKSGDVRYLHAPADADCSATVQPLAAPPPFSPEPAFWARYAMWLRTTREARLRARETDWKIKNKRQRIPPAERTRIAQAVAPTSLFDCLWRLRIRSNYGSVDPFLVPTISETDHLIFSRSLRVVTHATVALLEHCVARRIGREEFAGVANNFATRDRSAITEGLLVKRTRVIEAIRPATPPSDVPAHGTRSQRSLASRGPLRSNIQSAP